MILKRARSGLSPAVEELVEGFDSGRLLPLPPRERRVETAMALAFAAVAVAMVILGPGARELSVPLAVALVLAYAVALRIEFVIGYGYTTPTQLVFVPMLFLLPLELVPLLAALAGVLNAVPEWLAGRRHPARLMLAVNDEWYVIGPTLVLWGAGAPDLGDWPLLVAALGAQLTLDALASSLRDVLGLGISPKLEPSLFGWGAVVDVLLSPIGLLAAIAAQESAGLALLTLPLCALMAMFARERRERTEQALELSRAYRGTTLLLSDVLEADDEYTGVHSQGVVSLSVAVADELGLDSRERRNVEFGALLHDVGKIAVPNEIINKPGPLTDDEWLVIKMHTIEGQRMLDQVGGLLSEVGAVVRSSHERWDGTGYPDRLAGDEIPLASAIVSCCDAFNAMTTDRAYRAARTTEEALEELIAESGRQFNPVVVRALTRIVARRLAGNQQGTVGIASVAVP